MGNSWDSDSESNFKYRILSGDRSHEYVVSSDARPISLLDILFGCSLCVATWIVQSGRFRICIAILIVGWLWCKFKMVKQESILAMHNVGIQVKTEYWGGSSVSQFIPRANIEDVVINEGITLWQVKPYLAIIVKDPERVVVVFENLLPKLRPALIKVYHGTREVLLNDSSNSSASLF